MTPTDPDVPVGRDTTYVPPKAARNAVVFVVAAAVVTGWVGAAFAPTLVARHPLLLIALNSTNRYLILATNQLGATSFYTVAILRRVVPTLAFYLIGLWYGQRAVAWLERRYANGSESVKVVERLFNLYGWWVVAIAPTTITCLLAGAARLRARRLVPLVIVSIAVRLILLRQLGAAFSGPVDAVVRWIDRFRGPLLIVSVGSVAFVVWSQRRRRTASIEALAALDDDLVDGA